VNVVATTFHSAARHFGAVITVVARQVSSHGHKGDRVAVIVSVVGLVAIIVLIVFLGSLSVRRRMREDPPGKGPRDRGPRRPERGLFG
jgi:uncharacterized membrane protein